MTTFQDVGCVIAPEATFRTYVPGVRGLEILGDQMDQSWNKNTQQGAGLRVGSRFPRAARRVIVNADGTITIPVELVSRGLSSLLDACFGTSTVTLVSGTTYQHNFTVGDTPKSLSVQEQLVEAGGTIDAYSWLGCMVDTVEFNFPNVGLATMVATLDAADLSTAQSYVAPTFPPSPVNLFHFSNLSFYTGAFTPATTTVMPTAATPTANIRSMTAKLDRNLIKDRFNGNGAGRKSRQLVGSPMVTGTLVVEYDSTTYRDLVLNDGNLLIVATITAGALSTGLETFTLALPAIKFDGEIPKPNGDQLITQSLPFTCMDDLTNTPFGAYLRTADATL